MSAKSRSKSGNADDKTNASDSDADNGFFFLNELGNGLLQTCVLRKLQYGTRDPLYIYYVYACPLM